MSWEAVTRWALRCDGRLAFGQWPTLPRYEPDDPDGPEAGAGGRPSVAEPERRWPLALWTAEQFAAVDLAEWRGEDWLRLPDGRVLCPEHVAAAEHTAWAALEGLPFPEDGQSGNGPGDEGESTGRDW